MSWSTAASDEALYALTERLNAVSLGSSDATPSAFDVTSQAAAEPGDDEWLAASPLHKLTHDKALPMIAEWLDIAMSSVTKIHEEIQAVDKLSGDADEQIIKILVAAENHFRDITWRFKQTRLYLRTSKKIGISDRMNVWSRAREIFQKLEITSCMAGSHWPYPAQEAMTEVKRNTNTDERQPRKPAQPRSKPASSQQEDGWQKTSENIDEAWDLIIPFKSFLDKNEPIEGTGLRDDDVREAFMEVGTNLDFFYRWSTQTKPAPYALKVDQSGKEPAVDYTAWVEDWPVSAPNALTPEQAAAVRGKVPKLWMQEKDIRRKINDMSTIVARLADSYPLLDDYLHVLTRLLKALGSMLEAVPLLWWEKPDEVKEPERVDSRDEIVRADGTAYSAKKSKAKARN